MTDEVARARARRTTTSRPRRSPSPRRNAAEHGRRARSASCASSRRAATSTARSRRCPSDEEIGERKRDARRAHAARSSPCCSRTRKIDLHEALLDSDVPEDPYLSAELERYFPAPLPERFGDADARAPAAPRDRRHRRWSTTCSTAAARRSRSGCTRRRARRASQIARAYACAREIFEMRPLWGEIEELDSQLRRRRSRSTCCSRGAGSWSARRAGCSATGRDSSTSPRRCATSARGRWRLYASITRLLAPEDAEPLARRADELREQGVPEDLATRVAALPIMFSALDIVDGGGRERAGRRARGARCTSALGSRLGLHWLRDRIVALPRDDRWRARARAALRDDLYAIHREITSEVLRSAAAGRRRRSGWWTAGSTSNPASERALQTLGDIRSGQSYDLTTLPVAVREMRNLIARRELGAHVPQPARRVLVARRSARLHDLRMAAVLADARPGRCRVPPSRPGWVAAKSDRKRAHLVALARPPRC